MGIVRGNVKHKMRKTGLKKKPLTKRIKNTAKRYITAASKGPGGNKAKEYLTRGDKDDSKKTKKLGLKPKPFKMKADSIGAIINGPYYKKHGKYPGLTQKMIKRWKKENDQK